MSASTVEQGQDRSFGTGTAGQGFEDANGGYANGGSEKAGENGVANGIANGNGVANVNVNMNVNGYDAYESADRSGEMTVVTEESEAERKLRWKIDLQIVPLATALYLLSFLDRTNIGQAKLNGLQEQLHLSEHDYRVALTVLYVPYIVLEIPSNLVLKRFGPARWIPGLVATWGLVSTLQGIVTTRTGLYINRAFLGVAEAGILPGLALYLTFFYKPHELQLRQALYFSGASLSGAFSGLLSTAISQLDGKAGLGGWSWIFILEGIFTVLFGLACLIMLPNSPAKLWWLTPTERALAASRLRPPRSSRPPQIEAPNEVDRKGLPDAMGTAPNTEEAVPERFAWRHIASAFTDPLVLIIAAGGFCDAIALYSVAFFSPTVIKSLNNYTTVEAQLLSCPPFACAFVVSVALAFLSDRLRWRFLTAFISFLLMILGFGMAYGSADSKVQYAGICVLSMGAYAWPSCGLSWISNTTAGHYKRATSIALLIVFTNSGGIASTWLFQPNEAPRYRRGYLVNLIMGVVGALLMVVAELYIIWENKQRRAGKRDWRVTELRQKGMSDAEIRAELGDYHPEFRYML